MNQPSTLSAQRPVKPTLLGPWRSAFQWLTTLLVLAVPFVSIGGDSLLRLDFTTLTLHVAGRTLPIEALWLLLLFTLLLVVLFLLVTLAFGRAWCGWACPQTTLVDLVEWCARRIGVKVSAGAMTASVWQQAVMQMVYLSLALLVGANLTWYFIAPAEFLSALRAGSLHWSAWTLLGGTAATVYLDLALLRRLFCKEFCPYGRFQTALVDAGTLTLRYHPDEAPRCIRCGACVRACPTGIDIRNGYQVECINCGRCLDACREVMARRGQAGIIRYTFGLQGRGLRALLNPRMALVAAACLFIGTGLLIAATQRSPLTLKAARNPTLLPQVVAEDRVINFFTAFLVNRSDRPVTVSILLEAQPLAVQWRGPASPLRLAGSEHRRLDFGIESAAAPLAAAPQVRLVLQDAAGNRLAATSLTLTGPLDKPAAKQSQ